MSTGLNLLPTPPSYVDIHSVSGRMGYVHSLLHLGVQTVFRTCPRGVFAGFAYVYVYVYIRMRTRVRAYR